MCTTCCTTRSLNRPFVSHPCSRVTACINYLLCLTTNSIVSRRAEPWFLFKTRIAQLYNRARRAACGVGKHKQITNCGFGGVRLLESRRASYGADVQLVGDDGKEMKLALTHNSVVYCCILCLGTFCQCGVWEVGSPRDQPVTGSTGQTGEKWKYIYIFFNVPPATDATTLVTASLQLQSSSAGNIQGKVQCIQKRLHLNLCASDVCHVFLFEAHIDL